MADSTLVTTGTEDKVLRKYLSTYNELREFTTHRPSLKKHYRKNYKKKTEAHRSNGKQRSR